jgi:hypothetical protein
MPFWRFGRGRRNGHARRVRSPEAGMSRAVLHIDSIELIFLMPIETTVDAEDLKSRVRELRRFL